jgi:predicted N-formylglutamate amidohydrolase
MLLEAIEPEVLNGNATGGLVIICEHASNHIPSALKNLGLDEKYLNEHIAIDIGAEAVTRAMAEMMGVTAIIARVSRLVIDCNREADHETLVPETSDQVFIPGNADLTPEAIATRRLAYYEPFHQACDNVIEQQIEKGEIPLVIGMHSFTDIMNGFVRPWQIGFLWNKDPRLAEAMMGLMERETDLTIGNNEPYSGKDLYYTMNRHGMVHGLPQTTIEIRQDLLNKSSMVMEWAALLADMLDECMQRSDVRAIRHY